MRGDLSETTLAAICRSLASDGATGSLVLESVDGPGVVTVKAGSISDARSPRPRARLADRLTGGGHLDELTLARVVHGLRTAEPAGGASPGPVPEVVLARALLEQGLVDPMPVEDVMVGQVVDALVELSGRRSGPFSFLPAEPGVPGTARPNGGAVLLDVEVALAELRRRADRLAALPPTTLRPDTVPHLLSESTSPSDQFDADAATVLAVIDDDRNLQQLAEFLGYGSYDLATIVASLYERGVIALTHPQDDIGAALDRALRSSEGAAKPDGRSEASQDGGSEASPDGRSEASPDDRSEASPDGRSEASPDGRSEASPDGRSEASPDGRSEPSPDGDAGRRRHGAEPTTQQGRDPAVGQVHRAKVADWVFEEPDVTRPADDPAAADSAPADLATADAAPADPASGDIAPADLAPAEPPPADPAPGDIAPADATPGDGAPTDHTPPTQRSAHVDHEDTDVSEFLRELSALALGDSARPKGRSSTAPGQGSGNRHERAGDADAGSTPTGRSDEGSEEADPQEPAPRPAARRTTDEATSPRDAGRKRRKGLFGRG